MGAGATVDQPSSRLAIVENVPIVLDTGLRVEVSQIRDAVDSVNSKLGQLAETTSSIAFNIFEVLDFRMLSGMVGESLVSALTDSVSTLERNPNIDGYPDLIDVSKNSFRTDVAKWRQSTMREFIAYPHGGIEVKNTFGTKKTSSDLLPGQRRISRINKKLDWKAHHRSTNHLLAGLSDFVGGCPQIVAVMYSDELAEEDWAVKQNPKEGSTMTSFSVIKKSGYDKLRQGLRLCLDDHRYQTFLSVAR
jgi:hypothetical protein